MKIVGHRTTVHYTTLHISYLGAAAYLGLSAPKSRDLSANPESNALESDRLYESLKPRLIPESRIPLSRPPNDSERQTINSVIVCM